MKRTCLAFVTVGLLLHSATIAFSQPPAGPGAPPGPSGPPGQPGGGGGARSQFSSGSVESLEDLNSVIIRAPREQIEAMLEVIDQIDRLSQLTQPDIELVPLNYADSESLVGALTAIFAARQTTVTQQNAANVPKAAFVPLAQPNSIVVIAKRDDMQETIQLIRQMDEDAGTAPDQFKVFPLQRASALAVQAKLQQFFTTRENAARLRVRVEVLGDERTNSVVVHGSPADLAQAGRLIEKLDSSENAAINELRVFPLRNAIATELANLLNSAINYQRLAAGGGIGGGLGGVGVQQPGAQIPGQGGQIGQPGLGGVGGVGAAGAGTQQFKNTRLRFLAIDEKGKPIESGIIEDIIVLPDDRTNSLIVTAPPTSMGLVVALIEQLDRIPNPAAELKVFTLKNSDADTMVQTLQSIFSQTGTQPGAGGIPGLGGTTSTATRSFVTGGEPGELSRIPLTFASDFRTNSVIVTGTPQDVFAVEMVILKLEATTALQQRTIVYPLRNLTAADAATALTDFLSAQDALANLQEGRLSLQDQIAREVTIVPEQVTNKLIVSASPRYFDEIMRIISEIDVRPPQVVIQVLIAEVTLSQNDELGVELGTQSSVLFDRSIVVNNQLSPGFNFNTTQPLTTPTVTEASEIGLQSLSNFALGRGNPALGFGGLILTASSDNLSVLLRALQQQQRLDVLSRPQVMTSDSRTAIIQIGQNVPIVSGSTVTQFGVVNQIDREDVGIILQVTPRISPDGIVVMDVAPQVSALADTGVPIGTDASGATIQAPVINITQAQTNIAAADGQTVVIGGLILKTDTKEDRKIPFLGDIPLIGWGFRYRQMTTAKRELLIILTPHIIYTEADAQYILDMEEKRINWILSNVEAVHGDIGLTPPPVIPRQPPGPAKCTVIEPRMPMSAGEEVIVEEAFAAPEATLDGPEMQAPVPGGLEADPTTPQASMLEGLEMQPVQLGKVGGSKKTDSMSDPNVAQAGFTGRSTPPGPALQKHAFEELPIVMPEDSQNPVRPRMQPVGVEGQKIEPPKSEPPAKRTWWGGKKRQTSRQGAK